MSHALLDRFDLHTDMQGPEDGAPLIILHGWGSSAKLMDPIASRLADRCRVLNVDLPGHGHSPKPPEAIGIEEHADLVAALIDRHFGGRPVTLVGHSNGGRIGLYMASDPDYEQLIARLVLIAPSGVRRARTWSYHVKRGVAAVLKAPLALIPGGKLKDAAHSHLRHTLAWQLISSSDYRQTEGVMRETFVRTVNSYVEDRLDRISVPVLLFWGDEDEAITREQMETLEREIPDAGLVELPGAGHYAWMKDLQTVVSSTRHFLSENETRAA